MNNTHNAADLAAKIEEMAKAAASKTSAKPATPPKVQSDFFTPDLYDVVAKDNFNIMDVALYRLSKGDKRIDDVIRHELRDGNIVVTAGKDGMATIWDYDLLIMAISSIVKELNEYKKRGKTGLVPGRVLRPHITDVLKFLQRKNGGKQRMDLVESCRRLSTTFLMIERRAKGKDGKGIKTSIQGEPLLSGFKVINNDRGEPEFLEMELPRWLHQNLIENPTPEVLTMPSGYFSLSQGLEKFLVRLSRQAAGNSEAKWTFKTIYDRSGSKSTFKKFTFMLRKIIESDDLPDYTLSEERNKADTDAILVMKKRKNEEKI